MAISPREVVRSTSCLVIYGGVFVVGGSNGAISGFAKSKMAARPPSGSAAILENSKGDIYPADRPIYAVFGSRMGFSESADRMARFPVSPNPRWLGRHLGKFN